MSASISPEEARRGIYIDFEGPRNNPALLGMLYRQDDDTDDLIQFILDEALHPAWVFDPASFPTDIEVAVEVVLKYVENTDAPRRLFAWSRYEEDRFRELLSTSPFVRIADQITNARKLAASWRRSHFPEPPGPRPPMGQRNPLSAYLDLVGYRPGSDRSGFKPAEGIAAMLQALRQADRVDQVPREAADAWRATLCRNRDDCFGMRAVMIRVAKA